MLAGMETYSDLLTLTVTDIVESTEAEKNED